MNYYANGYAFHDGHMLKAMHRNTLEALKFAVPVLYCIV